MKKISIAILCILLIAISGYYFFMEKEKSKQTTPQTEKVNHLTIFVHGTIIPLRFSGNMKQMIEEIKKPNFKEAYNSHLDGVRNRSSFRKQPIGPLGLHKLDLSNNNENSCSKQCYSIIEEYKNIKSQTNTNDNDLYYLFGWDGSLSNQNRIKAAFSFYEALASEVEKIKKNSDLPIKITILAHSHGGNVALNLAEACEKSDTKITIDELILFGTPIQVETKDYANSKVFKKIYNFYSRGDAIQTLDVVSTKGLQSKRKFNKPQLKTKLKEIEVKIGNKKPIHCELWFSGDFSLFRKNLEIYPYPTVSFSPEIISLINQIELQAPNTQNFLTKIQKLNKKLEISVTGKLESNEICEEKTIEIPKHPNFLSNEAKDDIN